MVAVVGGCSPAWLFQHIDTKSYGRAFVTALAGAVCFCVTIYGVDGCGEEHLPGAEPFGRLVLVGLVSSDNQDETCSGVGWRREGVARPTAAHSRFSHHGCDHLITL